MSDKEKLSKFRIQAALLKLEEMPSGIFSNWEQGYIASATEAPVDLAEMLEAYAGRVERSKSGQNLKIPAIPK